MQSGGVQEEVLSLRRPVLVIREIPERPEGVEAGTARLVASDADSIVQGTHEFLEDSAVWAAMASASNPHRDGRGADRIVSGIDRSLRDSSAC